MICFKWRLQHGTPPSTRCQDSSRLSAYGHYMRHCVHGLSMRRSGVADIANTFPYRIVSCGHTKFWQELARCQSQWIMVKGVVEHDHPSVTARTWDCNGLFPRSELQGPHAADQPRLGPEVQHLLAGRSAQMVLGCAHDVFGYAGVAGYGAYFSFISKST